MQMEKKKITPKSENQLILSSVPINELTDIIRDCVREEVDKAKSGEENSGKDILLKPAAAARFLKVSKVTLFNWRKAGILPYHRIASRIYFKKHELIEAMKTAPRNKK